MRLISDQGRRGISFCVVILSFFAKSPQVFSLQNNEGKSVFLFTPFFPGKEHLLKSQDKKEEATWKTTEATIFPFFMTAVN